MTNVYNIFTGKLVDNSPTDRWTNLEARFGDSVSPMLDAWRAIRDNATEPYNFGDVSNAVYRPKVKGFWNEPMPMPCVVSPNVEAVGTDCVRGLTEPFPWMDIKYRTGLDWIKSRQGKSVKISTRSDLIVHDEYIAELSQCASVEVEIVMLTPLCSEELVRLAEPGAPSHKRRRYAYEKLKALGFNVRYVYAIDSMGKRGKVKINKLAETTLDRIKGA